MAPFVDSPEPTINDLLHVGSATQHAKRTRPQKSETHHAESGGGCTLVSLIIFAALWLVGMTMIVAAIMLLANLIH